MDSKTPNIPAFIGSGWSFPPEFLMGGSSARLSDGIQEIQESLQILLSTIPGDRVMQPKYGCDLSPMLFEPLTTTLRTIIEDRVKTSILLHEPRIEPERVRVTMEDPGLGQILIDIAYRIRANNTRHNYVFPFYIDEGTETR